MNVSFIPTTYCPSSEKRWELQKMQEEIHFHKVHYFHEIKHLPPNERARRKAEMHKMFRDKWEVVLGGKSDVSDEYSSNTL